MSWIDDIKDLGKYNLQICITDMGYQIDFIDPKKYNEYYHLMEEKGIIVGSTCRDYGIDVSQHRATKEVIDCVVGLEYKEGIELTEEEYEIKELQMKEQFGD